MKKNPFIIILLVSIIAFALAACGGSQTAETIPEPVTFTIDMNEYTFAPDNIKVRVGQMVTIDMINTGFIPHELMFGRAVVMTDGRPDGYVTDLFKGTGAEEPVIVPESASTDDDEHIDDEHMGTMVWLKENGDEASVTFLVTEEMIGEWEMGCFEMDGVHYELGMKGTFVVTSKSG